MVARPKAIGWMPPGLRHNTWCDCHLDGAPFSFCWNVDETVFCNG